MRASRVLSMRDAGSSYACAAAMHRVLCPPQIGMHNGHVPRLGGCIRGALVCHAAARLSTEPGQIERVCGQCGEGLYVGAMTHPHAPSTLGARVA